MAFDAKAHAAALEPPAFVAPDGRTHVGRILSTEEVIRLHAVQEQLKGNTDPTVTREFVLFAFRLWFPQRWWQRLFGLPSAAERAFLRLPEKTQAEAFRDFTRSQRNAMPVLPSVEAEPDPLGATSTT